MVRGRIKPMVEGGILAAVAIIFAFISAYLPVLGPFINFIWPVPMIILGVRHGYKWSIMATIVAGLLIALLMHPLHALSVVVGFGLIGIVLGHAFRADYSAAKTMLWGTVASLISTAAIFGIGFLMTGKNPMDMGDILPQAIAQAMEIYRSMGMNEAQLAQMQESMQTTMEMVKIILPAGFMLAAVVTTYLNFLAAKMVLKKLGYTVKSFPPFKEWSLPFSVIYLFAVALIAVFLGQNRDIPLVYQLGMNVELFAVSLLFIQGLALIYYLADKYNLSRMFRGIILVLVFTNGFFSQVVIFAGVFDLVADYRRIRRPRLME